MREKESQVEGTDAAKAWVQARITSAGQQGRLRPDESAWALMGTLLPGPLSS